MMHNNKITISIKIIFTIVLFFLLIKKINFSEVLVAWRGLPASIIISALLINIVGFFLSAYKWSLFLPNFSFGKIISAAMVGRFYAFVLPGQIAGEIAKAYRVNNFKNEVGPVVSSVIMDKITGLISLMAVTIIGVFFSSRSLPGFLIFILMIFLFVFSALLLLAGKDFFYKFIFHLFLPLTKKFIWFDKLMIELGKVANAWRYYAKNRGLIFYSILVGCVFQLLGVLIIFILGKNLMINLSFFDFSWIFGMVSLALLLPLTLGGLGIREGTFIGLLGWMAIDGEKALALSLIFFALQIFDALIGGVIELTKVYRPGYFSKSDN